MQINGPIHIHGSQPMNAPHRTQGIDRAAPTNKIQGVDQLDISHEADQAIQTREVARIISQDIQQSRAERLAEIKAQIQAGTYETEQKLELAVGNLLDDIG